MEKFLSLILFVFLIDSSIGFVLRAYISQHGLLGEIEFTQKNDSVVSIRTNLKATLQYPDQIWTWTIREFPVDYRDTSNERCSDTNLGKQVIDLTEKLGYLIIPGKDHAEFEINNLLVGKTGFWGKSILFKTVENNRVVCASIVATDKHFEKMSVARFVSPIGGTVTFRWVSAKEFEQTGVTIISDLYYVRALSDKVDFTQHKWKIYVTDIFDSSKDKHEDNCNVLQLVFDPENRGEGYSIGDLDARLGKLKVSTDVNRYRAKSYYNDDSLILTPSDMEVAQRNLYIVVFDPRHPDSYLGCAQIRNIPSKSAKSLINMEGVRGLVEYTQKSPYDPTWVHFQLAASDANYESTLKFVSSIQTYSIHELPHKLMNADSVHKVCETTGDIYNPNNIDLKSVPPPGLGTQDQYPIGDLLGKYKDKTEYLNHKYVLPGLSNELSGSYWDIYLPLQGIHSVMHRSLVVTRNENAMLCGTVLQYEPDTDYQMSMSNAEVLFRYPIVGRIMMRQPLNKPWEDTTIIVEYMIHADGSNLNTTHEHRWAIHENPPGKDFYNWTGRCLSARGIYDPHKVDINTRHPEEYCKFGLEGMCRIGDFTSRHGSLTISGSKITAMKLTRRLFTDSVISLTGKYSVMKKSLVMYDDHGPIARGERMACSSITGLYRRKAVVRDWFSNGLLSPIDLSGKIELIQQSEYDMTNAYLELDGMDDIKTYKIHEAPVQENLEFPCEGTTLYGVYNPFNVEEHQQPLPIQGTTDQYQLGDLGSKFGPIAGHKKMAAYFNETLVSLFGPFSIIGRSVVLHQRNKKLRWACSTIERGYSPSEAREIRAIASFHHPLGFAYGYIRMTQLIHNDGSKSDTIIEVNLKYPGVMDRNVTYNHKWSIFVNPVSVDATVKIKDTRCVAGGYVWNPYYTQLADPLNTDLYNKECGPDNPLRCYVGDITSRLGTINIGTKRQVFTDSNFPLEGDFSAVGRSIVIMDKEFSNDKFACANIEPDKDIIKYANIQKPPRFIVSQFLEEVRKVMGVPEWMLTADTRKTKTLHQNTCIQFLLHFKGPQANQLELDFSRLMASGKLDSPSIYIPGYVDSKRKRTISYKECGVVDPNEKKKSNRGLSFLYSSTVLPTSNVILLYFVLFSTFYFNFRQTI